MPNLAPETPPVQQHSQRGEPHVNPDRRRPDPSPQETTLEFLSEGQQMRLRIAERHLSEYRNLDLAALPPAVAIQTAQRLANTLGDLVSLTQDVVRKASRAKEELRKARSQHLASGEQG